MAQCEECGRHLRTGRKYCFIHRSLSKEIRYKSNMDKDEPFFSADIKVLMVIFIVLILPWILLLDGGYKIENIGIIIGIAAWSCFLIYNMYRIFIRAFVTRKDDQTWYQIFRLPNWVYWKMKNENVDIVIGDYYSYKRENGLYYRKPKDL